MYQLSYVSNYGLVESGKVGKRNAPPASRRSGGYCSGVVYFKFSLQKLFVVTGSTRTSRSPVLAGLSPSGQIRGPTTVAA